MGIDDDIEKRRKKQREAERRAKDDTKSEITIDSNQRAVEDKLVELFDRAERMIEQVNALYAQYLTGLETNRPDVRRKQLDDLMASLVMMPKPTVIYRFRYQNINSTYVMFRERWDRNLKDLENGKIKRVVGPKARKQTA
jgi:hypothetical protein